MHEAAGSCQPSGMFGQLLRASLPSQPPMHPTHKQGVVVLDFSAQHLLNRLGVLPRLGQLGCGGRVVVVGGARSRQGDWTSERQFRVGALVGPSS